MKKIHFLSGILGFATIALVNSRLLPADAALLVSNTQGNNIVSFDETTGEFLGEFIGSDRGLINPDTVIYGPDGNLYVSSFLSDEILRYDGKTGNFIDVFARGTGTADGLNGPNGLLFAPDGFLYVTTQGSVAENGVPQYRFESQVLRYNPATGEKQIFARQPALLPESLGFVSFLGLAINPQDGELYVSDYANGIRHYDLETGALKGAIATNYTGTQPSNNFTGSLAFGADGNLFTVGFDFTQNNIGSILRYDGTTGAPLPLAGNPGALFVANNSRLQRPIGLVFSPPVDVPEPGLGGGLLLVALCPLGVRAARSFCR